MNALGGFLIVSGCLFIVAGLAQFLADIIVHLRPVPAGKREGVATEAIKATADLLTAVGKLPNFALSVAVGLLLVAFGQRAAAGMLLIPW